MNLQEKVARAIYEKVYETSIANHDEQDWLDMRSQFFGEASAAIAIVLEEAAKVAIAHKGNPHNTTNTCTFIADDIRRLVDQETLG